MTEAYWRVDGHESAVALDGIGGTAASADAPGRLPIVPPERRSHLIRAVGLSGLALVGVVVATVVGGSEEVASDHHYDELSRSEPRRVQRLDHETIGREARGASPREPAPTPDEGDRRASASETARVGAADPPPATTPSANVEASEPAPVEPPPTETAPPPSEPVAAANAQASDFSFGAR